LHLQSLGHETGLQSKHSAQLTYLFVWIERDAQAGLVVVRRGFIDIRLTSAEFLKSDDLIGIEPPD
jgi:hypothetical protein